jgi:hypothetical protein
MIAPVEDGPGGDKVRDMRARFLKAMKELASQNCFYCGRCCKRVLPEINGSLVICPHCKSNGWLILTLNER